MNVIKKHILHKLLIFILFATPGFISAQVQDDFSDNDFTNNPTWTGDVTEFLVTATELQSNGPAATSVLSLVTPNTLADSAEWNFDITLKFSPTGSNFVRAYLMSDAQDIENTLNGYFIQYGETNGDTLDFYRVDAGVATKLFTGITKCMTSTSSNTTNVRITRNKVGDWTFYSDCSGTQTFTEEGTFTDNTYTTTAYFGFYCAYSTVSRATQFYFDNVLIQKIPTDQTPPVVDSVVVISATELDVYFSEGITQTSAETTTNYLVDNSIGNPTTAVRDGSDTSIVHLTFSTSFTNGQTYNISASNIEDGNSNIIDVNSTPFFYFVAVPASKGDIVFNEIFADPSPQIGLPAVEYFELYNTSSTIYNLKNWQYINTTTAKVLPEFYLYPDSYVIICASTDVALYSGYGDVIGLAGSWTALSNSADSLTLLDNSSTIIDIVSYKDSWYNDAVKQGGGYSLELINPNPPCGSSSLNWSASNDASGGTPGTQNSIYSVAADVTPPTLSSLSIINTTTLQMTFNEPMDSTSVVNATYTFDNGLSLQSITVTNNYTTGLVTLNTSITEGVIYNVTITGATDCSGNNLATTSKTFFIGSQPAAGEVIFSEIFADPTPQVGLPTKEYVELYNTTSKLIDLSGCVFEGTTISSGSMLANEYIILCAMADTALFSPYGKVIGLSSWPSLTNNGELLTLENQSAQIIDEVNYDISWYGDAVKNDGGYSLEIINPDAVCPGGSNNWTASNDPSGGTPGAVNSVYDNSPDVTDPDLLSVTVLSDTSLLFTFSELMDTSSIKTGTYTFDNGLSSSSISITSVDYSTATIYLTTSIDTAVYYNVTVTNVSDCPGNGININTATFVIGYRPIAGEVIINEIFADPSPEIVFPSDAEFVELFNTTSKLFDLSGYSFDGVTIPNGFIDPDGYVTICRAVDTAVFNMYGKTIGLTSFPSLTNGGELLTFEDPNGDLIDEVEYSVNWHTLPEKENGGWSLELINPYTPCSGPNNWASSTSFDGATPGYQNSIYDITPDVIAPSLIDLQITGSSFIVLTFDEPLDTATISSLNISVVPSTGINAVGAANTTGDKVYVGFATNIDTAVTYTITVSNMQDCIGNINTVGGSISFEIGNPPTPGDLIINEIFADPSPIVGLPEAEYIELYNNSSKKIDLGSALINGKAINSFLLEAGDYAIITADEDTALFTGYHNVVAVNSWPALNNTSMELTLTNLNNEVVDYVRYFVSWYNNDDKDGGGWSLERKDPNSTCNFANNWSASTDASGGTPGYINSVYDTTTDVIAPTIDKVSVMDSITLLIQFSESMDATSLMNATYTTDNGNTPSQIIIDSTDYASVTLIMTFDLQEGVPQAIVVEYATDCPGNLIAENLTTFVLPQQGVAGDLVINEVLFNPSSKGQDFVEVYNNSDKYIDLGTWYLANYANDSISNIKAISTEQQIIAPKGYFAITKDTNAVKYSYPLSPGGKYIQAATLPTYSNSDGVVILLNNKFEQVDRFDYDENMHFAILNSVKGVSLERIDFNRETNDVTNWHSAAQNVGFATPGLQNSQYQPANPGDDALTVEPEIFSPDEDGYNDVLNISYELGEPGYVGNVTIFDSRGRIVRKLMINEYLSPQGTISWDGKLDSGEKGGIGIYIIWAEFYSENGDVIKAKKSCVLGTNL